MDLEKVLDQAHALLLSRGEAMHRQQISEALAPQFGADVLEVRKLVYKGVESEIRRLGKNSRFDHAGRALYVASECYDPSKHKAAENQTKCSDERAFKKRERAAKAALPRICGNCHHIEFTGPHIIQLESGTCKAAPESGRWYPRSCEDDCELWKARSRAQRQADRIEQAEANALITSINLGLPTRRKRKGP